MQIDGSQHKGVGEWAGESCLGSMIDDATSRIDSFMGEDETTEAAMLLFREWVEVYLRQMLSSWVDSKRR